MRGRAAAAFRAKRAATIAIDGCGQRRFERARKIGVPHGLDGAEREVRWLNELIQNERNDTA